MGKMKNFAMDVEEFVDGYFMDEGVLDHDETFETRSEERRVGKECVCERDRYRREGS